MKYLLLTLFFCAIQDNFKQNQLTFERVKEAYQLKHSGAVKNLLKHKIDPKSFELYIRVFKTEKIVELWAKDKLNEQYKLFRTYDICYSSGQIGPKRQQGDYQVPEGYYHIDRFNPKSKFHLSLGINYPNPSDEILGTKDRLGGDIFIHGDCVSVGCVPITDNEIKSLYVYCVEATNNGQERIPVSIFPKKLDHDYFEVLIQQAENQSTKLLWQDLKKGYDYFNTYKKLPNITFLSNGRHQVTIP